MRLPDNTFMKVLIIILTSIVTLVVGAYAIVRLSDKKRLQHNWGQDYLNTLWEHTNSR